jgi:hypothetical protein
MMDAKEMFPEGFHPFFKDRNTSFTGPAKRLTRTARPPKYYLIDFGISCQFNPSDGPPLEWPVVGGDKTVPEFKTTAQYDPFPTDVYYLGNMIREQFLQVSRQYSESSPPILILSFFRAIRFCNISRAALGSSS